MRSAGGSSQLPFTPCYAATRRTPRPRRRTCNRRPLPRQRSSSHTAPTNTCSTQPRWQKQTKPTTSNSCPTPRHTTQHRTPIKHTHHQAGTTPAQHTRAPQAPHTRPAACARHQPPLPHATVRQQVPPTASHRMPPLRTPPATTNGLDLHPRPLGLPWSCTPPHPPPPLRGPQQPPQHVARGPSRIPPREPAQLLWATHRHHQGPPGSVLIGGRGGPRVDHSCGLKQHTPAPPQPIPTPQREQLERSGPQRPPRGKSRPP